MEKLTKEIYNILGKVENIFLSVGFEEIDIKEKKCFEYGGFYCTVSYVKQLRAIVIETADSKSEVLNNIFEDSDVYEINKDTDVEILLGEIKEDLIRYYIK